MAPNLESKVLQNVSDTGLIFEPTSGLDQESNGGSGLAIVNCSDLDTAGRVDDGSKRTCETRGVANNGGRCSQHSMGKEKAEESKYGWKSRVLLVGACNLTRPPPFCSGIVRRIGQKYWIAGSMKGITKLCINDE